MYRFSGLVVCVILLLFVCCCSHTHQFTDYLQRMGIDKSTEICKYFYINSERFIKKCFYTSYLILIFANIYIYIVYRIIYKIYSIFYYGLIFIYYLLLLLIKAFILLNLHISLEYIHYLHRNMLFYSLFFFLYL